MSDDLSIINMTENAEVQVLFKAYYDARDALRQKRAELCPVGAAVMSQIDYESSTEIIDADVPPDFVKTASGILRWNTLEIRKSKP